MSCGDREETISSYVDGELDASAKAELERHLAGCAACAARERELRALSQTIREGASRPTPDAEQVRRLGASLRERGRGKVARTVALGRYALVAAAASVLAWLVASWWARVPEERRVGDEIVAAHVRSLLADHLTDVASSDRHTVNPWFQGKLDCAVGARDFAGQQFVLEGGRLDYVDGRVVAALVYRHAQHAINLFVWPARPGGNRSPGTLAIRGYHIVHWDSGGTERWLVSDADETTVHALADLVQSGG